MGKELTATDAILGKNTNFAPDQIFSAQLLENAGATTSGEFLFPQSLGKIELKIVANTAVATSGGETLVVSVQTASASGGSFTEVFSKTIPASTTIAAGDDVASYIAAQAEEDCYTKVVITSDYDASAQAVDGIVVSVM